MFCSGYNGGFEEWRMITGHHLYHGINFSFGHLFMINDELIIFCELGCGFGELVIML